MRWDPTFRHALLGSKGERYAQVIDEEHLVEGRDEVDSLDDLFSM
jgi:hypothetical protein